MLKNVNSCVVHIHIVKNSFYQFPHICQYNMLCVHILFILAFSKLSFAGMKFFE